MEYVLHFEQVLVVPTFIHGSVTISVEGFYITETGSEYIERIHAGYYSLRILERCLRTSHEHQPGLHLLLGSISAPLVRP